MSVDMAPSGTRCGQVSPAGLCKLDLSVLRFDVVAEGRQTTRNCNNQVAGDGGKSMSKVEFQSWETNVSKVRQYSRDGKGTGG